MVVNDDWYGRALAVPVPVPVLTDILFLRLNERRAKYTSGFNDHWYGHALAVRRGRTTSLGQKRTTKNLQRF